jgi:hypothetical protein
MSREVDRGAIVGRSDVMQEVFRLVEQVAPGALNDSDYRRKRHR